MLVNFDVRGWMDSFTGGSIIMDYGLGQKRWFKVKMPLMMDLFPTDKHIFTSQDFN